MSRCHHSILPTMLSTLLLVCCLLLSSCSNDSQSQPRDIMAVNGCPEFLDLTWEMTKAEIEPLADWDAMEEDYLIIERASLPNGLPEVDVLLQFSGVNHALDSVMFFFPRSVSEDFASVAEIYIQLYGQASSGSIEEQQLGWLGESTNIYVMKEVENITVAYLHAVDDIPLAQMDAADFMDYIDPFAFLGDPALLGYSINDLITDSGYIEGVDYQVFSVSGQTVYTFLTGLHYMGADNNETYIEMYTQEDSDIIEYFTYGFVYPESEVSTLVEALQEAMPHFKEAFGDYQACVFAPGDSLSSEELSWEDLCTSLAALQEGTYSMLWIKGGLTVTLNITVDATYQGLINSTLGFAPADYWQ